MTNNNNNTNIKEVSQDSQIMLNWALWYQSMGLFILPLVPEKKMPFVKWKDRRSQKPTAEEIKEWLQIYPNAQIGMATGEYSGIDVLDFDSPDALPQFECIVGPIPQDGPMVITGRAGGGLHIYFRHTPGLKNRTKIGGLDVDLRTTGGIVVLPPSLHKSGYRYQWKEGLI